uniref:C-type lectin domain-containing protein n=1 Tax=Enterobius vermicularis TaxID=51028 RepID=A0A0N4UXB2_ENTVE
LCSCTDVENKGKKSVKFTEKFLTRHTTKGFWIGFERHGPWADNSFRWLDGSNSYYRNWDKGYPISTGEFVKVKKSGGWINPNTDECAEPACLRRGSFFLFSFYIFYKLASMISRKKETLYFSDSWLETLTITTMFQQIQTENNTLTLRNEPKKLIVKKSSRHS